MITRDEVTADYLSMWKKNWILGVLVFLMFISTFWSVDSAITIFRSLEVLFATLVASYTGIRYRPAQLMEFIFWFGAIILILSVGLAYGVPKTGTMYWAPFNGAWRGIYWHRNHLGIITAFVNVILLCRVITAVEFVIKREFWMWLYICFRLQFYTLRDQPRAIFCLSSCILVFSAIGYGLGFTLA